MRAIGKNIAIWKSTASAAAISMVFCAASGIALAAKPGPGGGHPPPHAAAVPHPAAVPHFTPHATPHFTPHVATPHMTPHFAPHLHANPHLAGHPQFAPHSTRLHTHYTPHIRTAHQRITPHTTGSHVHNLANQPLHTNSHNRFTNSDRPNLHSLTTNAHPLVSSQKANFTNRPLGGADRASFLAHRRFAGNPTFRPFFGRGWHPYHHLGWIGPLFWPYAYGDFFYYALWPYDYEYVDPFWAYGYGDIYESIFSPYDYSEYVQGPGAPERMHNLTQGMTQSCDDEAAEVTGWPINQIQQAVQPDQQQSALLDNLGNAIVKASNEIKSHCPTSVGFTPIERLAQMRTRLQALVDAVNLISPPLTKFYDSLSDEQKARFNDIAPPAPPNAQASQGQSDAQQQGTPGVQAQCDANVMAWPTDKIDSAIHPSEAQRAKLDALQSALSQAGDTIKAACPTDVPATPPSRLDAIGNHLQAMLQAVERVQPALADFYNSLNDDQKARFNTMGRQLFAQNPQ